MNSSNRTDIVKLPLPFGMKAGFVVGRGGHNCRWLHYSSGGAHITVNDTAISIRAKDNHVRARAIQLVRRQLDAMLRLAMYDCSTPVRLDYVLLSSSFGADPRVRFCSRNDEVATSLGRKDSLFELVPNPDGISRVPKEDLGRMTGPCWDGSLHVSASSSSDITKCDTHANPSSPDQVRRDQDGERDQDLTRMWDRQQQAGDDNDGATRFHAATAAAASPASFAAATALATGEAGAKRCGCPPLLASAARALAAAAHKAACREPSFDALKIRFKLGKSLFRNLGPRASRTDLSVAELEGSGAGRGCFQSVFSTWVPASAVPRVTSWLTDSLGFSLADTKTTATLHVINQELNIHYSIALAMERGDDSTASLRKIKAGGSKNPSVTLMAAPQQLDLRLKLIPQFREHPALACDTDAHSTARRVAAAVRMEGFEGFTRSKRGLPRNRHLEYARRKTKFVYEGYLPTSGGGGQRLRVSVTQVQDDKGTHFEISGCLPDADAQLRQLLTQQQRPAAAAAEHTEGFIPEWRRRGRSTTGTGRRQCVPNPPTLLHILASAPAIPFFIRLPGGA
ncbi:hypothetical protein Vretifemale_17249 [Volvox reticuliferus]|uniref:K Homology domain-containing protein n=1 Tax=Volvox reticuliferus TaxID=1737510 RepID=A0A8J4FYK6_9CHLO|nr:hypothetical protein Vretifemale_17249 [Volvox reticuliferus]